MIRQALIRGLARVWPAPVPAGLMYHSVHETGPSICVRRADFIRHLEYVAAHRTPIAPDDLDTPGGLAPGAVLLTFDDGFLDNYEVVVPECVARGIPVLLFPAWERLGAVSYGLPMMTRLQLREIAAMPGVHIGSHTLTHPKLSRLSPDAQRREIAGSKSVLEDWLGRRVDSFCYPHGNYSAVTREIVGECGYRRAFTTKPGVLRNDSPFEIPRMAVNRFSAGMLPAILTEGYLQYTRAKAYVQGS